MAQYFPEVNFLACVEVPLKIRYLSWHELLFVQHAIDMNGNLC